MPLSAVCVSSVGGRHKNWSPAKDAQDFMTMNNSEEICSYQENSRRIYAPVKKPAYFEYDISDDKPSKKEKKWSFGNLFRRKKKANGSSSEEETKDKNRRKSDKRKKPITFDHVVISQSQVKSPDVRGTPTEKAEDKSLITSQETQNQSKSYISDNQTKHQSACQIEHTKVKSRTSLDNLSRKSRKDLTKVRAEARRTSINRNSSSEEDSQRSNSSQKFRSDESLYRTRDASANRRTRAARTERYLKRHSRDGENPNNYLRISKSDAESTFLRVSDDSNRSPSASPQLLKSSFSSLSSQPPSVLGLSTIPPSHTHHGRFRVSNSTSNPSYKPPLSINDYNNSAKNLTAQRENLTLNNQRSISFDGDIHRPQDHQEVIYAKLELGKPKRNLTLMDNTQLRRYYNVYQPPVPPPRDPKRLHGSLILDTLNHNNFHDNTNVPTRYNFPNDSFFQVKRVNSVSAPAFKSSSENHIPREISVILSQRPSSTTPETTIRRNGTTDVPLRSDNYQYLTDNQPRSRKPILIQNESKKHQDTKDKLIQSRSNFPSSESSSFLEQLQAKKSNRYSRGNSPKIFNSENKLQTEIFLPSVLPNSIGENKNVQQKMNDRNENLNQQDLVNQNSIISIEAETSQAKSANLEEALNELEAIYNSLKLGDENLLEMAEKRENEVATQKMLESNNQYSMYNGARGAFSDSGFSYEPFDSLDSRRRRKYSRKSLRSDDMAVRKLNKQERAATITDPQAVASKISYLLTSPIYTDRLDEKLDPNEPDVTLDDVVYRNIKQLNKMKVPEHPPPFGIPLGPITLASNSDYLHAVPVAESVKPSRMPDLVKDDLAFRNLRKDNTKEPALPPVSSDDLRNNNLTNSVPDTIDISKIDLAELKKKRAVRSKSANIGSLISQEVIERASRRNARDKNVEYKTLADIADAMQIARQVLREKERKVNETKIGSLSDTDFIYPKYSRLFPSSNINEKMEDIRNTRRENTLSPNVDDSYDETMSSSSKKEEPQQTRRFQVKESTPDPISSFEDGKLAPLFKTNSFEDVLTALAIEAKEASDKFTQELKDLDAKKYKEKDQKAEYDSPKSCKKLLEAVVNVEIPKQVEKGKDEEDIVMESVATIVFTKDFHNNASIESYHDYANLTSELDQKIKETPIDETDRIESSEGIKIRDVNETRTSSLKENANKYEIQDEDSKNESGETCADVVMSNAFSINIINKMSSTDFCSSDSDSLVAPSHSSFRNKKTFSRLESSNSLKSPKLVLETSKLNERQSKSSGTLSKTSCNSIRPSSSRSFFYVRNIPEDNYKSICFFENNNPASLAIACSYGLACLYQLAALDLYTILGIVLAMFTFIVALFF